jgi:transposase-like protein
MSLPCPHCQSAATTERPDCNELGYPRFREAVREWAMKLAPHMSAILRKRRHGTVEASWYVDDTYIRAQGRWCYLDRAIDRDGNLGDARRSDTRDFAAAEAFFRSAWTVTGVTPDRITTDGHNAYPRAIRNVFGEWETHGTNRYLNNHLEQDHRGIKQRYRPTFGLKIFATAARFCRVFDEIRAFLPPSLPATRSSRLSSAGASIESDLPT